MILKKILCIIMVTIAMIILYPFLLVEILTETDEKNLNFLDGLKEKWVHND